MKYSRRGLLLFFPVLWLTVSAALNAQHLPGTHWKQRETEHFVVIYPDTLSDDAAALAVVLDEVYKTITSELPPKHPKKKWPLVLTDMGVISNGYVTLMPRRSVWYNTPGEDFTSVSDWWMMLARHEGLHLGHFDFADQGLGRFLHIIAGELGWGAALVFGLPSWLLEGDAIYSETYYSGEGRGRDPLFRQEMALIAGENPKYHRIANPSYREHHPSVYHLGYELALWIRQKYGDEAMQEVYRRAARTGLPIIGIDVGMMKATGKHPREIFDEMIQNLNKKTQALKESVDWTEAELISEANTVYTTIDPLYIDSENSAGETVFVRRTSLAKAPRMVQILPDGSSKNSIRLPRYGRVSMTRLEDTGRGKPGYRVLWNSIRRNPSFNASSVSDLTVVDLNEKGGIIRRFHPVKSSRYLYPAISPNGEKMAAAEMVRGANSRLVILNAKDGAVLNTLELNVSESAAYPFWSADGERVVFSVRSDAGRRIAEWRIASPELQWLTPLSMETVKTPVYAPDGRTVVYSGNRGGFEALWALDIDSLETTLAARRWFSASSPYVSPSGEWLYLVEYSSAKGERLARVRFPNSKGNALEPEEVSPQKTANSMDEQGRSIPDAALRDPENREAVVAQGNEDFPESDYKPEAVNIHTWGFLRFNIDAVSGVAGGALNASSLDLYNDSIMANLLRLGVQSRNILNTFSWDFGASYDTVEVSPGAYMRMNFTGIRPNFYLESNYMRRRINTDSSFNYLDAMAGLRFPANLSRGGIWYHTLVFDVSGGVKWLDNIQPEPKPAARYAVSWNLLRPGSRRAVNPDWGIRLVGAYTHIPPANGDMITGKLSLYMPGGLRNTSLKLSGGLERNTWEFSPLLGKARGYSWENPEFILLASADYEFPLLYPDVPFGAVFFLQRIRMGLHSDFSWLGDALLDKGPLIPRWSTGATLTLDFTAFNNFPGLSFGMMLNYLWHENKFVFGVIFMDLPLF
ncbi:MAG: hypothetical protein B0D92_02095 [Spirochaeta sp. LUC14_002_19_P3]|nr:MAG: hypothetical protein B0D92_02095 [Spirochaeta sp. LUC14_002_19_P3]